MKFGVQYYPSHWPETQWPADVSKMKEAGVKFVRMGDLGWSAFEKRPGELDFSEMDRAIDLFGQAGIKTVLCTVSRTPPPWLYRQKPGMLPVDQSGLKRHSDGRYAVAMAHSEFIEEAERIDEATIRHFAGNENIVAWQIDNEIGCHTDCYCERCQKEFHRYLENKYKTPNELNEAWGTDFWAFRIDRFEDVPSPVEHPHLQLEYRRFLSALNKEFAQWRARLMRAVDPGKPITTNFQNLYWDHTDYHDLAEVLDVNGMNHYPARTPELALDCFRGGRGEVWVLEQQTHLPDMDSPPGWMRLRAWMAIAHGASAVFFFRWRQCLYGCEQFGDGILPHSGQENRLFAEFSKMGRELENLAPLIEPTRPRADVAVAYSYASRWAVKASVYGESVDPVREAIDLHSALNQLVTSVDALDPRSDLSGYKLVIAPRLWLVDEAVEKNLRSFVRGGGCLCLTTGSGVVDEYGKCFSEARPGRLSDLAGIWVSDLVCDADLDFSLRSKACPALNGLKGRELVDDIHLDGAEVIAEHGSGWRKGSPAVTRQRCARGQVVYIGVRLDREDWLPLTEWLLSEASIPKRFERDEGVSVYEREGDEYRLRFLLNWTNDRKHSTIGTGWLDAITGLPVDTSVAVEGADLRVLKGGLEISKP